MMDCMMGGMMPGGMMTFGSLIGFLLLVGLGAVVALGVVWLMRRNDRVSPPTETPMDILNRRLAQGEITAEEFSVVKRQLQES